MEYSFNPSILIPAFLLLGITEVFVKPAAMYVVSLPLQPLKRKLLGVFGKIDERIPQMIMSGASREDIERVIAEAMEKEGIEATEQRVQFVKDKYDPTVGLSILSEQVAKKSKPETDVVFSFEGTQSS